MKAGRELDALVAEKVFAMYVDMVTMTMAYCSDVSCCEESDPVPAYSTNIADAWMVVEKLGNWHGFTFLVVLQTPQDRIPFGAIFEAGWYELNDDGLESRAMAQSDTAPHAICLAALKAVQL